jgi:Fe-S cluster assembly ATP-binding protein
MVSKELHAAYKLEIRNLHVSIKANATTGEGAKEILHGVNLTINSGERHSIMGPNGSGKSTLAYAIAGHPQYEITDGEILLTTTGAGGAEGAGAAGSETVNLVDLSVDARARAGVFLAQQHPVEVEGVTLSNFLRTAKTAVDSHAPGVREWVRELSKNMDELKMDQAFGNRALNVGFSGGEKKRAEILQLKVLKPKFAILDETDSGLDVDALRIVCQGINDAQKETGFGVLLITHYTHILEYIVPDFVHVFVGGQIVESGSAKLAKELEASGYEKYTQ